MSSYNINLTADRFVWFTLVVGCGLCRLPVRSLNLQQILNWLSPGKPNGIASMLGTFFNSSMAAGQAKRGLWEPGFSSSLLNTIVANHPEEKYSRPLIFGFLSLRYRGVAWR